MKTRQYALSGLLLAGAGASSLFIYLRNVEAGIHFSYCAIGVIFIALGVVLSNEAVRKGHNVCFLLVVVTLSMYSLSIMPAVRFNAFSGMMIPDSLDEFFVAKTTLAQKHWGDYPISSEGRQFQYFSCLSVTIFPTILSEITGMSLFGLFEYVYPLIFCLIPLMVFILGKQFFKNNKLAALSSILFVEYYNFSTPRHAREYMALLFLLLTLFVIFKHETSSHRRRTYIFLAMFFEIGVVTSHYTVAYFMSFMFVFTLLFPYLLSALQKRENLCKIFRLDEVRAPRPFNKHMIAYLLTISTGWLFFVSTQYTFKNLLTLKNTILAMLGIARARWTSYTVAGTTSGPIVLAWYVLCFFFILIGFVSFLFYEKKNRVRIAIISSAFSMFIIVFFLPVIPTLSKTLTVTRVFPIALPLWIPFFAYAIASIVKRFRRFGYVFLVSFLLFNLPISMSLISHSNFVLYSPEKVVPPQLAVMQIYIREDESFLSEWTQNYLPIGERISVDLRGRHCLYSALNVIPSVVTSPEGLSSSSKFLFLHSYTLRHSFWWSFSGGLVHVDNLGGLIANRTVIYNNGHSILLMNTV